MRRALLLLCALAGCAPASPYRPAVDLTGVDPARFETDLSDCKKVAERDRYGPVLAGALIGAGMGAGVGAVGGMFAGNAGLGTSYGAISGTVAGTGVGATQVATPPDEKALVDQCLRNNGYRLRG
jgi:outer membrane lipoprotein SlyB